MGKGGCRFLHCCRGGVLDALRADMESAPTNRKAISILLIYCSSLSTVTLTGGSSMASR